MSARDDNWFPLGSLDDARISVSQRTFDLRVHWPGHEFTSSAGSVASEPPPWLSNEQVATIAFARVLYYAYVWHRFLGRLPPAPAPVHEFRVTGTTRVTSLATPAGHINVTFA